MAVENLNDIPAELKPLAPFLQRSQELKVKDPTMSYWCKWVFLGSAALGRRHDGRYLAALSGAIISTLKVVSLRFRLAFARGSCGGQRW